MDADYVENIIRNIDKQSYKCILVDGAWGIGKSYMVRKALEDMKDRTCFISLFGIMLQILISISCLCRKQMVRGHSERF